MIPDAPKDLYFDLQHINAEGFETFVFDHLEETDDADEAWYLKDRVTIDYDEQHHVSLYAALFKSSANLLERYSTNQLEQGIWSIMGAGLDGNLNNLIWSPTLSTAHKVQLIASIYDLCAGLFSLNGLDLSCHMLWDDLAYNFHPMKRAEPKTNSDDCAIQDAMHQTLCHILELKSPRCQNAALHGFNHVQHPDTEIVIRQYLKDNPSLNAEDRDYALSCMCGEEL